MFFGNKEPRDLIMPDPPLPKFGSTVRCHGCGAEGREGFTVKYRGSQRLDSLRVQGEEMWVTCKICGCTTAEALAGGV